MFMRRILFLSSWIALFSLATIAGCPSASAEDMGESPKYLAMKNRATAPKASDLDTAVTLQAMLERGEDGFSVKKAGTVTGYIVQVEREPDGDMHVVMAGEKGETSTTKWVIVEVTPAWQKRKASLSTSKLRKL